jgi:hypothetical protein
MKRLILPGIFVLIIIWAYTKNEPAPVTRFVSSAAALVDEFPASSPNVTKDSKGNTVISWVRKVNDSSSVFCYSVMDYNNNFKKTVVVPSSTTVHAHAENLPRIVFKPSGEIIAVWGARNPDPRNKYSGLICYSQSFDDGLTWSTAKKLVNDTAGHDQRYSDVVLMKNGEAAIAWLDNRTTTAGEGSALYCAVTDGVNGFVNERLVSEPACQCCRTKLFCDRKGNLHVVYRGIINDSIRDMVHVVSRDNAKTFSAPERIHDDNWILRGCPHTGPSMTENGNGLHFAWYTGGVKKGSYFITSTDNGRSFKSYDSISTLGTHPQLTSLSGGEIVGVWDESIRIGEEFYKRVGMQVRNARGIAMMKDFVTADTSYSTYPVIAPAGRNAVVIAYTSKVGSQEFVKWQRVQVIR